MYSYIFKKAYYIHLRLGWLIREGLVDYVIQDLMCSPLANLAGGHTKAVLFYFIFHNNI